MGIESSNAVLTRGFSGCQGPQARRFTKPAKPAEMPIAGLFIKENQIDQARNCGLGKNKICELEKCNKNSHVQARKARTPKGEGGKPAGFPLSL